MADTLSTGSTEGVSAATPHAVVGLRRDRFGARLCAFFNAYRIAQALGVPAYLGWPESEGLGPAEAQAVFSDTFRARHLLDPISLAEIEAAQVTPFEGNLAKAELHGRRFLLVNKPFGALDGPETLGTETPLSLADAARATDPFAPDLKARAAALKPPGLDDGVAFHVRRGDLADPHAPDFLRFVGRYVPYAFYRAFAERAVEADRIAVFSDAEMAADTLRLEDFGKRVTRIGVAAPDLTATQRAVVELLLLARAGLLVGGKSAFRETAAELSGARNVRLHDAFDAQTKRRLLREELERADLPASERSCAAILLARELSAAGERAVAAGIARDACAADPTNAKLRLFAGRLLTAERRWDAAEAVLHEAVALAPDLVDARQQLGTALLRQGRSADALAHLAEARRQRPERRDLAIAELDALIAADRTEAAEAALTALVDRLGAGSDTARRSVRLRAQLGDRDAALRELDEALRRYPDDAQLQRLSARLGLKD